MYLFIEVVHAHDQYLKGSGINSHNYSKKGQLN